MTRVLWTQLAPDGLSVGPGDRGERHVPALCLTFTGQAALSPETLLSPARRGPGPPRPEERGASDVSQHPWGWWELAVKSCFVDFSSPLRGEKVQLRQPIGSMEAAFTLCCVRGLDAALRPVPGGAVGGFAPPTPRIDAGGGAGVPPVPATPFLEQRWRPEARPQEAPRAV